MKFLFLLFSLFFSSLSYGQVSYSTMALAGESSVKVLRLDGRGGGSGFIAMRDLSYTMVMTNKHVCQVIEEGGLVEHKGVKYLITAYAMSDMFDLCAVQVVGSFGVPAKISHQAPKKYDRVFTSGHPSLKPHTITEGTMTGKTIIPLIESFEACDGDDSDKNYEMFCAFFGVKPVIKLHEALIATAFIEPGSSGSAVMNEAGEVVAVAFAGDNGGVISQSYLVPFESLNYFIFHEFASLPLKTPAKKPKEKKKTEETKTPTFKGNFKGLKLARQSVVSPELKYYYRLFNCSKRMTDWCENQSEKLQD